MLQKIRYRLVFNRSGRLNNRGEGLIQIECSQALRKVYFSTHCYVSPDKFHYGRVTGDNADSLNYALYLMIQDIEKVELEYIKKGVDVNLQMLKDAVKTHISPAAKISEFGLEVIKQGDRKSLTIANYRTLLNNLERFKKGALITDIDYQFIVSYDKWLRESGIMHNTRVSRLRLLRAILNEAKKRDLISTNPFERFRIQQMVSKKGYITSEQLSKLEKMQLKGRDDIVRDAFLFGCYTGLRFSDITSLRQDNIQGEWLVKKMQKTGSTVEIPLAELFGGKALAIIQKYNGNIGNLTKKIGSNQSVNKVLRGLLDKIGADPKITFHSSRHTCATLLGQKGVDIAVVQKILGHTKMQTTEIYREVDRRTIQNSLTKLKRKSNGK